jgi:hypothetical protein
VQFALDSTACPAIIELKDDVYRLFNIISSTVPIYICVAHETGVG